MAESADIQTNRPPEALPNPADLLLASVSGEHAAEQRRLRLAVLVAVGVHVLLLLFTWPDFLQQPEVIDPAGGKKTFLKMERFELAPSKPRPQRKIPEKKTRKIPIPDPTPEDPEPTEVELPPLPDVELPDTGLADFGIPDAPPSPEPSSPSYGGGFTGDAFELGSGDITPPARISGEKPPYTETARQAQIQGYVLLRGVIDAEGNVRNLEVLRRLPQGLTESALETVVTWKYKPAVKDGKAVAVYSVFNVRFSLQ